MNDDWVLVVDDDADTRDAIAMTLRDHGYYVMTAENGGAALVALISAAAPPSCIVSDARMPVMDGWALWCELAVRQRLASVPFILLSAYPYERAKVDVLPFLAKPIDTDALVSAVRRAIAGTGPESAQA